MKSIHRILALAVLAGSLPAFASTVAYWRFEEGPAGAPVPHGGAGDGVFYAGTADSSGNSNELSVWAEGWAGYGYRTDVAAATVPQTGSPQQLQRGEHGRLSGDVHRNRHRVAVVVAGGVDDRSGVPTGERWL